MRFTPGCHIKFVYSAWGIIGMVYRATPSAYSFELYSTDYDLFTCTFRFVFLVTLHGWPL